MKSLEQFQQKYDYSSPLFPMIGKDIWGEAWEEFKKDGASIVPQKEIDADQFFNGDGDDYKYQIPVISYQGCIYESFIKLLKAVYGEKAREIVNSWNEELAMKRNKNNLSKSTAIAG